jgi:hypothetical protein
MHSYINQNSVLAFLVVLGCTSKQNTSDVLRPYLAQEKVDISLTKLGVERVPEEIAMLKSAKEISISGSDDAWTVYPPFSTRLRTNERPPFQFLPDEICELTQLESLSLVDIDLTELPECFDRLHKLKTLNLSMNKIDVVKELDKLSKLKSLSKLDLIGNKIDTLAIKEFQLAHPQIEIRYSIETVVLQ